MEGEPGGWPQAGPALWRRFSCVGPTACDPMRQNAVFPQGLHCGNSPGFRDLPERSHSVPQVSSTKAVACLQTLAWQPCSDLPLAPGPWPCPLEGWRPVSGRVLIKATPSPTPGEPSADGSVWHGEEGAPKPGPLIWV